MQIKNKSIALRLWVTFAFVGLSAAFLVYTNADSLMEAVSAHDNKYQFTRDGKLVKPEGYREWIYVGTPVTPNDLNNGKAAFPEFHNVYIHPSDYKYYKATGKWQDGTISVSYTHLTLPTTPYV